MDTDMRFRGVILEAERQIAAGIRPSIQITVEWNGKRVLEFARGAGATTDSNYLLWSTTKPFVAVTLLQLIEAGRASLEDRIEKFVPEFGTKGKEPATLLHVLTHRGGFPDVSPDRIAWLSSSARDWHATLKHVCELPATWAPGTARGYHPFSGWHVLGEVIQRIDDRPLSESVRRRVLEPCGIAADGFSLGEPESLSSAPLPVASHPGRGPEGEEEAAYWNDPATHSAVIPGAGGISRAGEVVKLYRALLRGGAGENGRILSPSMTRAATFPHVAGFPDRTLLADIPWGLGFHLRNALPGPSTFGATATPGSFGHGGHFLVNVAWADPGKNLAACILANGLTEVVLGTSSVAALSQAIHDALEGD